MQNLLKHEAYNLKAAHCDLKVAPFEQAILNSFNSWIDFTQNYQKNEQKQVSPYSRVCSHDLTQLMQTKLSNCCLRIKGIGLSDSKGVDGEPEGWLNYITVLSGDIHDARAPLLTTPPKK